MKRFAHLLAAFALVGHALAPAHAADRKPLVIDTGQVKQLPSGDTLVVNDDAYDASGWNGSTGVPTKNAVRDKVEAVVATIPSAYTAENARDDIGAALVAGANVTITPNDGADTITIAASGGGGGGLSDGDYGDITVGSSSTTLTIDNDAVSYAKIQNVSAASKLLGRGDSGSGDTQEITLGSGLSMSGTTLSASGGGLSDGDKGDITVASSGAAWSIDTSAVTLAKIANAGASSKLLGSGSSGSGAAYAELSPGNGIKVSGTTLSTGGLFNPPTAASFSLASGDATNLTLSDDADVGLLVVGGTPVGGDISRIAYRTLTTPANDWDLIVGMDHVFETTLYSHIGLFMRDSTGGKLQSLARRETGAFAVINWSALAGFSGTPSSTSLVASAVRFFRIKKVGTAITYYVSANGKQWFLLYTTTATAYLANNPNQVGIFVNYARGSGQSNDTSVFYFSLTGTAV